MKRAWDYTQEELLELGPDEILRLKDMECMCEGAPLLSKHPGPEPIKPTVVGERVAFHVNAEMLFFKEEDAQEVLDLVRSKARGDEYYLSGDWRGPQGIKPEDPNQGTMGSKRFWTPEQWATHKLEQETYQKAKNQWDADDKEYREAIKAREKAVQRVDSMLEDAHEKARTAAAIHATWAQYLDLAGGDQAIALGFLYKLDRWATGLINETLGLPGTTELPAEGGTLVVDTSLPADDNDDNLQF